MLHRAGAIALPLSKDRPVIEGGISLLSAASLRYGGDDAWNIRRNKDTVRPRMPSGLRE